MMYSIRKEALEKIRPFFNKNMGSLSVPGSILISANAVKAVELQRIKRVHVIALRFVFRYAHLVNFSKGKVS